MFDEAQVSSADSMRELDVLGARTSRGNRQMPGLGMVVGPVVKYLVHEALLDLQKDLKSADSTRSGSTMGVDSR